MVHANDFRGSSDSEILQNAVNGKDADGIVVISPRVQDSEPERSYWLLDSAITLPQDKIGRASCRERV